MASDQGWYVGRLSGSQLGEIGLWGWKAEYPPHCTYFERKLLGFGFPLNASVWIWTAHSSVLLSVSSFILPHYWRVICLLVCALKWILIKITLKSSSKRGKEEEEGKKEKHHAMMTRCKTTSGGSEQGFLLSLRSGSDWKTLKKVLHGNTVRLMALYSLDVFDRESVLLNTFLALSSHWENIFLSCMHAQSFAEVEGTVESQIFFLTAQGLTALINGTEIARSWR